MNKKQNDLLVETLFTCAECKNVRNVNQIDFEEHMQQKHLIPSTACATITLLAHADSSVSYVNVYSGEVSHEGKFIKFSVRKTYKRGTPR